jgi:hypothetical protein
MGEGERKNKECKENAPILEGVNKRINRTKTEN